MKNFIALIIAAIFGGMIALGIFSFIDEDDNGVTIETIDTDSGLNVLYAKNESGELEALDFTEVAEKVTPAVVHIRSTQQVARMQQRRPSDPFEFFRFFDDNHRFEFPNPRPREGAGSGVIISGDGYIVTNNHVIENATDIEVMTTDKKIYKAELVGTDPSTDIALIKIDKKTNEFLPFVNSDRVRVGQWVMAIGNPFNLTSTATAGIVSAKARNINILNDRNAIESFIQTDAAINPGNSGGALVNLQGGLIGINTAIASPTGAYAGYGFAVPSNIVQKVVEDLLEYGVVQRGYLGVLIRGVNGNLAKEENLKVERGVFIDSLLNNSSAYEAGIRSGDVIMFVDNIEVNTAPELQEQIGRHRPGDVVELIINRRGKTLELPVTLKNKEGTEGVVVKEVSPVLSDLGAEFETISPELAQELNIHGGVVITELMPGKLTRYSNIEEGFIITHIDGKEVSDVEDLEKALSKKRGGVMVEGRYKDSPGKYYYAFGM